MDTVDEVIVHLPTQVERYSAIMDPVTAAPGGLQVWKLVYVRLSDGARAKPITLPSYPSLGELTGRLRYAQWPEEEVTP